MGYSEEVQGKILHDRFNKNIMTTLARCTWVPCPVIIGAGPSGLAIAACLKEKGIPSLILEKTNCIASMWKLKTYDRLRLHLPKQLCELPFMPFPAYFPTYPTKNQFMAYLESYKNRFGLDPVFNKTVVSAEFDDRCGCWRIKAVGLKQEETEYVSQWLIVATGENADEVVPQIEGMMILAWRSLWISATLMPAHPSSLGTRRWTIYSSLAQLRWNLFACATIVGARPSSRNARQINFWFVHVVAQMVPIPNLALLSSRADAARHRFWMLGLAKIKNGDIKVFPGIKRITQRAVEFVDGRKEDFDAIILATGYKSNVPQWLKGGDLFSEEDGMPREAFPRGWKGERGLYAVGFTKRGLLGTSLDAKLIAQDIELQWKPETPSLLPYYIQPLTL
ncbi:hypothetical protein F3Y22_tig00000170pilonHSYRG00034 [Hibiscus syriacus]|uniref:indole-3-pyruvate monooxygenase n=1 Tax=Hibiscus syriacus TaxID=106335 RepID=A0A6A3D9W2_HIBSY|nr:hypothetical protein F3Y22_tig00000170pilonHSYRG00034 [Hibiscus syriacus]